MGCSEVGLGMFKEDFERLIKKTKYHNADENDKIDAYNCLTKYCNHYYLDSYKEMDWRTTPPEEIGPKQELIILHWYEIKLYSIGMNYIKNFLKTEAKKSSFITWVGENTDDVGYTEYKWEESEIYWQEYVEPVASININATEETGNFAEFLEKLERRT